MSDPAPKPAVPLDVLSRSLTSHYIYETSRWTCFAGFVLGFSYRMEGGRNVPATGPALIISNHQSFLDPPIIGLATGRVLRFLARKTLFNNPFFASLIRNLNAVPIDQEGVGKDGIKTILKQLQGGEAVVVFPEGERSPKGAMLPLKPGIQLLIERAKSPIIPVGIAGAYDAWPRWRKLPRLAPLFLPNQKGRLAVSIGKPLDGAHFAGLSRKQSLEELFGAIHELQQKAERLRRA